MARFLSLQGVLVLLRRICGVLVRSPNELLLSAFPSQLAQPLYQGRCMHTTVSDGTDTFPVRPDAPARHATPADGLGGRRVHGRLWCSSRAVGSHAIARVGMLCWDVALSWRDAVQKEQEKEQKGRTGQEQPAWQLNARPAGPEIGKEPPPFVLAGYCTTYRSPHLPRCSAQQGGGGLHKNLARADAAPVHPHDAR